MLAMTEIDCAELPLLAGLFPDTAITVKPWKSFGAAQMEPSMPAQSCMEQFAVLVLIWAMTESLLTHWNQREVLLSEPPGSGLMGKQAGNNGLELGEEIIILAHRS